MNERHLERDDVGELLNDSYRAPMPEARADFVQALRTRLQRECEGSSPTRETHAGAGIRRRLWAIGSAAILVLGVGLGLGTYLGRPAGPSGQTTAESASRLPSTTTDNVGVRAPSADDALISTLAHAADRDYVQSLDGLAVADRVESQARTKALYLTQSDAPVSALGGGGLLAPHPDAARYAGTRRLAGSPPIDGAVVEDLALIVPAPAPGPGTQPVSHDPMIEPNATLPLVVEPPPAPVQPPDGPMTLEIEAFVDGKDYLIVRGDTLRWRHEEWAAVGRHEGFNEPTIISTQKAGSVTLDRVRWFPAWVDWRGRSISPRQTPSFSTVFSGLTPPLPARAMQVTLTPLKCRNAVSVAQQPSAENNYTLIVAFNDTDLGASWYTLRLTIPADAVAQADRPAGDAPGAVRAPTPAPRSGAVFVSDMPWVQATAGAENAVRRDNNLNGRPIAIAGRRYEKGVWTHAFPDETPADVVVDVAGRGFVAFLADAGVEQSSQGGTVQFLVLVDGEKRAESPVMTPGGLHRFLVDVTGAKQVTLRVLNGGDGDGEDHAAWGAARLIESGAGGPADPPVPPAAPVMNRIGSE